MCFWKLKKIPRKMWQWQWALAHIYCVIAALSMCFFFIISMYFFGIPIFGVIFCRNGDLLLVPRIAGLRAGWSVVQFPTGARIFLITASKPALGPTQPPIQWIPGAPSLGVKLTTHLHLVQRSRMRGAIPPLPNTSPCSAQLKYRDYFTF
jgi:hypothetical protein